jgi:hypothetical protein
VKHAVKTRLCLNAEGVLRFCEKGTAAPGVYVGDGFEAYLFDEKQFGSCPADVLTVTRLLTSWQHDVSDDATRAHIASVANTYLEQHVIDCQDSKTTPTPKSAWKARKTTPTSKSASKAR